MARLNALRVGALHAADLFALAAAFVLAALSSLVVSEGLLGRPYRELLDEESLARFLQFGGFGLVLLFGLQVRGYYRQRLPFWTEVKHIVVGCGLALLGDGFVMFAIKSDFSRLWLIQGWAFSVVLMLVARRMVKALLGAFGLWALPVLVVGDGEEAEDACEALRSEPWLGYDIIGTLPLSALEGAAGQSAWSNVCEARGAQFVVLALSGAEFVGRDDLIADLVRERVPFAIVPPLRGLPVLGFDRHYFFSHDVMMMVGRNNLAQPLSRAVKLTFDVALASVLTLLLAPVFVVFAALIARDGGPVFYRHARVGREGRSFACLKFRTMVPDAECRLEALLADPGRADEWRRDFKLKDDPRVTPIGRFLRASSLDELPQLFNVLKGDMSLVGPRPVTRAELDRYGKGVAYYLETRPGITGLWQVSGRNDTSYDQRVRLDVWYVKNWSLWHDVAILAKTIPVVLRRVGAY